MSVFFWSVVALFLVTYLWALVFTHLVWTNKLDYGDKTGNLTQNFGSLARSMLSLLKAVTGGVDWGDLFSVLEELDTPIFATAAFLVYVLFASLAMMNVITGIFLDRSSCNVKDEMQLIALINASAIFAEADENKSGKIGRDEFMRALTHKKVEGFFEAMELHPSTGEVLFHLLDESGDGVISADEFLHGCLRLRGNAKALDLLVISRKMSAMVEFVSSEVIGNRDFVEKNRQEIMSNRREMTACRVDIRDVSAMVQDLSNKLGLASASRA